MKYIISIAALAASVYAQGGDFDLEPDETSGCPTSFFYRERENTTETFTVNTVDKNINLPRPPLSLCGDVVLTLINGNMVDQYRRTASIVANAQFQFDGPPQAGAIYTAGWSACAPKDGVAGNLRLGNNETFYNCYNAATPTQDEFYNIYNTRFINDGLPGNCTEVNLFHTPCIVSRGPPAQKLQAGRGLLPPYDLNDPTANLDIASYRDGTPAPTPSDGSYDDLSSASSTSPSASSSSSSETPSSTSITTPVVTPSAATEAADFMTLLTESLAPYTETTAPAVAAPTVAPISNTTAAATGTDAASPTGPSAAPSPFTGAGSIVAACQGFVVLVAGVAALAML